MGITTQLTHVGRLATLPQHDKKIPALKSCNEEQKKRIGEIKWWHCVYTVYIARMAIPR